MQAYFDSSALVKLVIEEDESEALRRYMRRPQLRASCALARVEVVHAVQGGGDEAVRRARAVIDALDLVPLGDPLLDVAATLPVAGLRSLDAIHLAAALSFRTDLSEVVTYDERLARAARELGLEVVSPR